MGKIVVAPNDATATAKNRRTIHATARAVSPVAPGDTNFQAIARAQESSLVALSATPENTTSTVTFASGGMQLVALWVPTSAVAAQVVYGLQAIGTSLVSNGFNGAVVYKYDSNKNTGQTPQLTLVDYSTTSLTYFNSTQTSDSFVSIPMINGYTIGRGLYYVGIVMNFSSGTGATLYCNAGASSALTNLGGLLNIGRSVRYIFTGSTPPSTISSSAVTNSTNLRLIGLLSS